MPSSPLIELDDVTYVAGGHPIVLSVSWRIAEGEHWAVLGPNGSGKTTLLRLACGYLWPNGGGTVRREGRELLDLRDLRTSIGWITSTLVARIPGGEASLDTVVSGRFAQVGLKPLPPGPPTPNDYRDAEAALARLGCPELAARPFGVLSQGEQQKVLLARARMAAPRLIVLDEPCAGMDPGARERFLEALDSLASQDEGPGIIGPGIILVTHHLEEIMPGFERALAMRSGRVFRCGPTDEIIDGAMIEELYGVPVEQIVESDGRRWPVWGRDEG